MDFTNNITNNVFLSRVNLQNSKYWFCTTTATKINDTILIIQDS